MADVMYWALVSRYAYHRHYREKGVQKQAILEKAVEELVTSNKLLASELLRLQASCTLHIYGLGTFARIVRACVRAQEEEYHR